MTNSVYDHVIFNEIIEYHPDTGLFFWKDRKPHHFKAKNPKAQCDRFNKKFSGKPALTSVSAGGYLSTTVMGRRAMAHRAAWCMFHKTDIGFDQVIDHINGDPSDNRISNLRICTLSQNMQNSKRKRSGGLRGAFFHKQTQKYQSSIRLHLGTYDTEQEAADAYEAMAQIIHKEFYLPNGKRPTVSRVR